MKVANLKASDDAEAVFYEIYTFVATDGVEKHERNMDVTFKTRAEAEKWLSKQVQEL